MAHSTPTNQKPSNAPIFVHSSARHVAAAWPVVAAAAATKLPPRAVPVVTKTPVATAMAGAQMINNNQLKAAAAMAAK